MPRKPTKKQQAFIEHYLQSWNASDAARQAGYSERTAGVTGHDLLKNPNVIAYIHERLTELQMDADEVMTRLADQARANVADFVMLNDDPESDKRLRFNFDMVKQKGYLVKRIRETKDGIDIQLYDAQSALQLIGKIHAMFTDRITVEWDREIIQLLREGVITREDVNEMVEPNLAEELFKSAGISLDADGQPEGESADADAGAEQAISD